MCGIYVTVAIYLFTLQESVFCNMLNYICLYDANVVIVWQLVTCG